jgi:hypothetical protein
LVSFDTQEIGVCIRYDVDVGRGLLQCFFIGDTVFVLEMQSNRFHMFAGAESIDSKVGAGTVKLFEVEIADFDRIAQSAAGFDCEVRINGVFRRRICNSERFFFCADLAFEQFLLIGCPPVRYGG